MANKYPLSDKVVDQIGDIKRMIEIEGCRQMRLFRPNKLASHSKDKCLASFKEDEIVKFWQLGLLQADVVRSYEAIAIEGLEIIENEDDLFSYTDQRVPEAMTEGYADAFAKLELQSASIELLFHPFRAFVLYHLNRIVKPSIVSGQILWGSEGYKTIIGRYIERFNGFTSKPEFSELIRKWNNVASLCTFCEPFAHLQIFGCVQDAGNCDEIQHVRMKINKFSEEVHSLLEEIGEDVVEHFRHEICRDAETLDPNKNLHLVVRLMDRYTKDYLKGHVAGAVFFRVMAECLRRNMEKTFKKEYPEEDECGFGQVIRETKQLLQGSLRVLDGDRVAANQFLRRIGLDYGIRVNVYVEGETEFSALMREFGGHGAIQVINLKGQFVEKRGKGLAFRESLRNDIKSKVYSIIVFDGDVSDNLRAVRRAAEDDEICGRFFVAKPDFEFQNFDSQELASIAYSLANEQGHDEINLSQFVNATATATNGKDLFEAVNGLLPDWANIAKGEIWGESLVAYALKNSTGNVFGDQDDRQINQIILIAYHCATMPYEPTRQEYKVNSEDGTLTKRGGQV